MKSFEHSSAKRKNTPTAETVQTASSSLAKGKRHRLDIRERDRSRIPSLEWERDTNEKTTFAPILTIAEKFEPKSWLASLQSRDTVDMFGPIYDGFDNPERAHFEWYEHSGHWHNRLIHADSTRAMASLLEHEHMAGSVQCIYFDPPYGMDFDAKIMRPDDALVVTAFRDTYENGIHTYLSRLRETLTLARELLSEAGSLFMQIGDINVHRAALVLDEVFGPENRVSTITFKTTGGGSSKKGLSKSVDYLLWYAKDREQMYFQELYEHQTIEEWCDTQTFAGGGGGGDFPDGTSRPLRLEERRDPQRRLPEGTKLWGMNPLYSQGRSKGEQGKPYTYNGTQFGPRGLEQNQWSVDKKGLDHLAEIGRLWTNVPEGTQQAKATQLRLKIYRSERPARRITNLWDRTIAPKKKFYPVQTGDLAIQRCILMTTRPGDLVLDPTNGGGSTASVAESWGRRWITIDSSRESLAITRERLLIQNYPAHLLIGSDEGFEKENELRLKAGQSILEKKLMGRSQNDPATGIVVERMPYVSVAVLAYENRTDKNKQFRDYTWLVDRPIGGKKNGRVCGSFTVETEHLEEMVSPDDVRRPSQVRRDEQWQAKVKSALESGGFGTESGERYDVDNLQSLIGDEGEGGQSAAKHGLRWGASVHNRSSGKSFDAVVAVAPHDARVDLPMIQRMVSTVTKRLKNEILVVIGVEFKDGTEGLMSAKVIRINAGTDLHIKGVASGGSDDAPRLFIVAELAVELKIVGDNQCRLVLWGLNEFNPATGSANFRKTDDIRLWMLDTDYDGLQFHACRIHIPKPKNNDTVYTKKFLRDILDKDTDETVINAIFGYESEPFPKPKNGQVAVRAVLAGGGVAMTIVDVD